MKSIPLLLLPFDLSLQLHEVPAFRGAMLAQTNPVESMHNHEPPEREEDMYPVVQYKSLDGKAAILMLERGIDASSRLLMRTRWSIQLRGRNEPTTNFATLSPRTFSWDIGLTERLYAYRLRNWLPLNQKQFDKYRDIRRLKESICLLEERLAYHLKAFASGMEYPEEQIPETHILDSSFFRQHEITVKQKKFIAFNLDFETNFMLPPLVGLGAKTAFGFGVVEKLKN